MENESDNHAPKQIKPYLWKKGQSGNPLGRPKGKSLKEYAREYFNTLPDNEKLEYLESLPTDIVWRMAEGNPETKSEVKQETTVLPILVKFIDEKSGSNGNTQ